MISKATKIKYAFTKEHDPQSDLCDLFEDQKKALQQYVKQPQYENQSFTIMFSPKLQSYIAYSDNLIFAFYAGSITRYYQTPVSLVAEQTLVTQIQTQKETDSESILAKYILNVKIVELSPQHDKLFNTLSSCIDEEFYNAVETPVVKIKGSKNILVCNNSPTLKLMLNDYLFPGLFDELQTLAQGHNFVLLTKAGLTQIRATLVLSGTLNEKDRATLQNILKPKVHFTIRLEKTSIDTNVTIQAHLRDETNIDLNITTDNDSNDAIDKTIEQVKTFYLSNKYSFYALMEHLEFKDDKGDQICVSQFKIIS